MLVLAVHVCGRLAGPLPSASRSFTALSHDIVRWWDDQRDAGKAMTTPSGMQLYQNVKCAMTGEPGPFRGIRPSRKLVQATFDEVRLIALADTSCSERMRRIQVALEALAAQGKAPRAVLDAPSSLHWSHLDAHGSVQGGVVPIDCPKCQAGAALKDSLRALSERIGEVDIVVVYNERQSEYIHATTGCEVAHLLGQPRRTPCMMAKEFMVREKIAWTFPRKLMSCREAPAYNIAEALLHACQDRGVFYLVEGLTGACSCDISDIVRRGVRHRCMSCVQNAPSTSRADTPSACRPGGDSTIKGGWVLEPTRAFIQQPMVVLDFASLYPSIIVAHGFGESLGLPYAVRGLMSLRRTTADKSLAHACKLTANAMYGQLASPTSTLFDPDLANSITQAGRNFLGKLVAHIQDTGGEVVYGDTDSCMAVFAGVNDGTVDQHACKVVADFNTALPDPMRVANQACFVKCIFLAKKKYVALTEQGILVSIGTANVRSDVAPAIKGHYADLALTLLKGGDASSCIDAAVDHLATCGPEELVASKKVAGITSQSEHAELARCLSFRDDGNVYISGDTVHYLVCHTRLGGRRKVMYVAPEDAKTDSVARSWYTAAFLDMAQQICSAAACPDGAATIQKHKERARARAQETPGRTGRCLIAAD